MYGRSARTGYVGNREITDLERRASDVIKPGRVVEANYAQQPYLVRVGIGDPDEPEHYFITGWLPVMAGRSDEWNPLKMGEAVMVLSEAGEIQNGVVLPGALHNTDHQSPGNRGDLYRKRFPDGSVIEYDEAAGGMKLTAATKFEAIVGGASITVTNGQIVLTAGGATITIGSGGVAVSGSFSAQGGAFTHESKNVGATHKHSGVMSGPANTGNPIG